MAVAITLLVLNIGVPDVHHGQSLADALGHQWVQYVAYAVSFLTIGIIWINHHAMISRLREADHTILMLNLFLLLTIGLLPFATDLLATYLRRPDGRDVAAAIYSGAFLVMALAFSAVNRHILLRKTDLLASTLSERQRRRILLMATIGVPPVCAGNRARVRLPIRDAGHLRRDGARLRDAADNRRARGQRRVRISYASGRRVVRNGNSSSQSRR